MCLRRILREHLVIVTQKHIKNIQTDQALNTESRLPSFSLTVLIAKAVEM